VTSTLASGPLAHFPSSGRAPLSLFTSEHAPLTAQKGNEQDDSSDQSQEHGDALQLAGILQLELVHENEGGKEQNAENGVKPPQYIRESGVHDV
jgi:hypothetical protein